MSSDNDGGPAFARPYFEHPTSGEWSPAQDGMSLRDWFAGQAVVGIIASEGESRTPSDIAAKRAYEVADAMLKARVNNHAAARIHEIEAENADLKAGWESSLLAAASSARRQALKEASDRAFVKSAVAAERGRVDEHRVLYALAEEIKGLADKEQPK